MLLEPVRVRLRRGCFGSGAGRRDALWSSARLWADMRARHL